MGGGYRKKPDIFSEGIRLRRTGIEWILHDPEAESITRKHYLSGINLTPEVEHMGYKVREAERILGGFRVDVINPDGRGLAYGLALRRFFKKTVADPFEERTITLTLHSIETFGIAVRVDGLPFVIRSPDDVRKAMDLMNEKDEGSVLAGAAMLGLAARKGAADIKAAVPHLARALKDSSPAVRTNAARALCSGSAARTDISEAIAGLAAALSDPDKQVRMNSADALCRHAINSGNGGILESMSGHQDRNIRKMAKKASEQIGQASAAKETPYR